MNERHLVIAQAEYMPDDGWRSHPERVASFEMLKGREHCVLAKPLKLNKILQLTHAP